jgi:shikimate kinase
MGDYLAKVWIIAGISRSGKTTLVNKLGKVQGLTAVDMDQLVLNAWQKSGKISTCYQDLGEHGFRELETLVYQNFKPQQGMVIALGGGVLLNPSLAKVITKWGYTGWLFTEKSVVFNRWLTAAPLSCRADRWDLHYEQRALACARWSRTIWDSSPDIILQQMTVISNFRG